MLDKQNVDSIKPLAVAVDKLDSSFFAIYCVKIKCLLAGQLELLFVFVDYVRSSEPLVVVVVTKPTMCFVFVVVGGGVVVVVDCVAGLFSASCCCCCDRANDVLC